MRSWFDDVASGRRGSILDLESYLKKIIITCCRGRPRPAAVTVSMEICTLSTWRLRPALRWAHLVPSVLFLCSAVEGTSTRDELWGAQPEQRLLGLTRDCSQWSRLLGVTSGPRDSVAGAVPACQGDPPAALMHPLTSSSPALRLCAHPLPAL